MNLSGEENIPSTPDKPSHIQRVKLSSKKKDNILILKSMKKRDSQRASLMRKVAFLNWVEPSKKSKYPAKRQEDSDCIRIRNTLATKV